MFFKKGFVFVMLFPVLFACHFLLDGWLLLLAWCVIGVLPGIGIVGRHRFFFLIIFLMDVVIGLIFFLFWWNSGGHLNSLAGNSSLSSWEWAGLAIAINSISVLLCMYSSFCITRQLRLLINQTV